MKISGYPCKNVIKYFSIFSIKKPILFTVRGFAGKTFIHEENKLTFFSSPLRYREGT